MEHAYREITAYSESQELIITLCILLEPEETTLYYSYLRIPTLVETRLRNEAREITGR